METHLKEEKEWDPRGMDFQWEGGGKNSKSKGPGVGLGLECSRKCRRPGIWTELRWEWWW